MISRITRRTALAAPLLLAACASAPKGFLIPTYQQAAGVSLVDMLVITAPSQGPREDSGPQGPVVNHDKRVDTVSNQSEVDDLLASMGF